MKAIHILTDFYAKAGEGNDLIRQNQFSDTHCALTRNASRRTVNVEPDLQWKSDDMYQCHQLSPGFRTTSRGSSRRPQRPSPKCYAFFDEFTEKAVEGAWDSVETDTYGSHRRENSTRVICEYFERLSGH